MALLPQPTGPQLDPRTGLVTEEWKRYYQSLEDSLQTGAPSDAQYYVATADVNLTNERNLGALASGFLKITSAAGIATPSTVATIPHASLDVSVPYVVDSIATTVATTTTSETPFDTMFLPANTLTTNGQSFTVYAVATAAAGAGTKTLRVLKDFPGQQLATIAYTGQNTLMLKIMVTRRSATTAWVTWEGRAYRSSGATSVATGNSFLWSGGIAPPDFAFSIGLTVTGQTTVAGEPVTLQQSILGYAA